MAQAARRQQQQSDSTAVALRLLPPPNYAGTPQSWRVLCETIWPAAKSAESIMLAVSYCAARHLDPFKRPVHIVPVYNSQLRREVETVWPGINELLTTASRSKAFAGADEAEEGPEETRTFHGRERDWEDRSGVEHEGKPVSVTVTFPVWASVKVWRMVQGQRVSFATRVYWIEAYGRRAFRSELPKDMWETRPRGQLHKCALAASLRLGFPEDVNEYAAEEMEGREIEGGGVVIEGQVETGQTGKTGQIGQTARDRQADQAYGSGKSPGDKAADKPEGPQGLAALDTAPDDTAWLKTLEALFKAATTEGQVQDIDGHPRVRAALEKAPTLIRQRILDMAREAYERVRPKAPSEGHEQPPDDPPPPDDEGEWRDPDLSKLAELIAEVDAMDLDGLDTLAVSASWKVKTRDLFPPDADSLKEAIDARRAILKGAKP